MDTKKSYMSNDNIISEGFFNKIFQFAKNLKSDDKNKIKKNRKLKLSLTLLNKAVSGIEKTLKKDHGVDVELERFKLSDFF